MVDVLETGELQLNEEECEKLKLPPNSVIPADSADEIKARLQAFDDEAVKKLFRQIGQSPDEEPYPGTLFALVYFLAQHLSHRSRENNSCRAQPALSSASSSWPPYLLLSSGFHSVAFSGAGLWQGPTLSGIDFSSHPAIDCDVFALRLLGGHRAPWA